MVPPAPLSILDSGTTGNFVVTNVSLQNCCPASNPLFIETPANPNLEVVDIKAVGDLCKENGAIFIVDNIFCGSSSEVL